MYEYLKTYQNKIIQTHINKNSQKNNNFLKFIQEDTPPIIPTLYLSIIPFTHILSFLVGYYSHYFLKM